MPSWPLPLPVHIVFLELIIDPSCSGPAVATAGQRRCTDQYSTRMRSVPGIAASLPLSSFDCASSAATSATT